MVKGRKNTISIPLTTDLFVVLVPDDVHDADVEGGDCLLVARHVRLSPQTEVTQKIQCRAGEIQSL